MSDQWSYCPHCGVKLIAAAKFCHACGTAVNHEEQTQPESLQRKPEEEKISFGRWLKEELAEKPETPTKESETPLEQPRIKTNEEKLVEPSLPSTSTVTREQHEQKSAFVDGGRVSAIAGNIDVSLLLKPWTQYIDFLGRARR